MRPPSRVSALSIALVLMADALFLPAAGRAQEPEGGTPKVTSTFRRTGEELDRFELGAGVVRGFFDDQRNVLCEERAVSGA